MGDCETGDGWLASSVDGGRRLVELVVSGASSFWGAVFYWQEPLPEFLAPRRVDTVFSCGWRARELPFLGAPREQAHWIHGRLVALPGSEAGAIASPWTQLPFPRAFALHAAD